MCLLVFLLLFAVTLYFIEYIPQPFDADAIRIGGEWVEADPASRGHAVASPAEAGDA